MARFDLIALTLGGAAFAVAGAQRSGAQLLILDQAQPQAATLDSLPQNTPQGGAGGYGDKLTTREALDLIASLDGAYFGGWFAANIPHNEVLAIWRVESALKPAAINPNDPRGGSYGLGQVQAGIAAQDYGVSNPQDLLNPEIGGRVSMAHMKWTFEYLARAKSGLKPDFSAWAQAYNVGAAGYLMGARNSKYLGIALRKFI